MLTAPFELNAARPTQIGLVVLQSDETIEDEVRRLIPDNVSVLVSRVKSGTHVTSESLAAMEGELRTAAGLFPETAKFAAVGYGCTSGTAQIGQLEVSKALKSVLRTPSVTEPVSALIAACRGRSIKRIGLLSPYIEPVSKRLCEVLAQHDIHVKQFVSFNESQEDRVARISKASIVAAAVQVAQASDVEAVFVSCTNLRTLDVINLIEEQSGKPVFTSNQVFAWHLVLQAGILPSRSDAGQLWRMTET